MNKVELVGRLTRDPEVRYGGANNSAVARFTLACDRQYKRKDDEQTADFINCIAFGKTAEFIEKYFRKGNRVGACGRITTGSYTNKDGQKVYTTDVTVEEVEFVESKNSGSNNSSNNSSQDPESAPETGFMDIPDGIDEELPFR